MITRKTSVIQFLANTGITFLVILITSIYASAQQTPLKFSHLSVDNGLSHTDANDIKQDRRGFIWIATLFGLDRFDGYAVKRFYNTSTPKRNAFKNRIISMCLDEKDKIWIGTEDGIQLFDFRSEKYTDVDSTQYSSGNKTCEQIFILKGKILAAFGGGYPHLFTIKNKTLKKIPLSYPSNVKFGNMALDQQGNIWLSSNNGVWLLDRSFHFRHFDVTAGPGTSFRWVNRVFVNKKGQLLITDGASVALTKGSSSDLATSAGRVPVTKLQVLRSFTTPDNKTITDIIQDKRLNYWMGTSSGLQVLDQNFGLKQTVPIENSIENSLHAHWMVKLFIDRSECLWICTLGNGINISDLNTKPFYTLQHSDKTNSLSDNFVKSVVEESGKKVWIGTMGHGLNEYDLQTHKFKYYTTTRGTAKLQADQINTLTFDNDQNLWIGTDKGIQILNKKRNALLRPAGYQKFPLQFTLSLAKDFYGNLWFGNSHGFGSISSGKNKVYKVKYHGSIPGRQIWADEKKPELFISTNQGLIRLIIDSIGNVIKSFHYTVSNTSSSLSSDLVYPVRKQNDSTYWIGTIGGGLNRLLLKTDGTYHITPYDSEYNIFTDVESLEFDNKGNIWIGGNGLQRMNLNSKKLTQFDKNDGLQGNSFKVGTSYQGQSGRLYFGGINGLNYFFPDSIKTNLIPVFPVFTNLLINNKEVTVGDTRSGTEENVIEKSITYSDSLHLNYLQNNFVISFSAMDYANPRKCQYRYRLLGFDKEWKYTGGNNPSALFSNLDYDNYTLIVEATNNDGVWSKNKAVMSIIVSPPWWKSTAAKFLYLVFFISGLIGIYIYQARMYRLKRELSMHEIEEKKQEELYQQQLKLNKQIQEKNNILLEADEFKNKLVSILAHDFRSPLCSTISIARMMKNNQKITKQEMELFYDDIEQDATKMLESFDIILQWIRQQLSGYKLKAETLILRDLFLESAELFRLQLDTKRITVHNHIPEDMTVISNKEMLQFINRNLLSNAIKFSPEGGRIIVGCIKNIENLTITVEDDGPGLHDTTLDKLFSISSQAAHSTNLGAGIALSMCKDFLQKLNGHIWAKNKKPHGAVFHYTISSLNTNNQRAAADA